MTNSPLQNNLNTIKLNIETLQSRNKEALFSMKESLKIIESNSPKGDNNCFIKNMSSPYNYKETLHYNYNHTNSNFNINNDYSNKNSNFNYKYSLSPTNKLNYSYRNYNLENSLDNGLNYNINNENFKNGTNYSCNKELDLNNLSKYIANLKAQVNELEETKKKIENDITLNSNNKNNTKLINEISKDFDEKELAIELKRLLNTNTNKNTLNEIKKKINNNKLKDEFLTKTTKLCQNSTGYNNVNLIYSWRWIKDLVINNNEYNYIKNYVHKKYYGDTTDENHYNLINNASTLKIIKSCIDNSLRNKKKVDKIKRILNYNPHSRSKSSSNK